MSALLGFASLIMAAVSVIHIYWAFGGRWGAAGALPEKPGGGPVFRPRMLETLAVAAGTGFLAVLLLAQLELLPVWPAGTFTRWSCVATAAVMLLRSIGDFRYVGFFKSIRHTGFGRKDTWFYSPLCLALAFAYGMAAL